MPAGPSSQRAAPAAALFDRIGRFVARIGLWTRNIGFLVERCAGATIFAQAGPFSARFPLPKERPVFDRAVCCLALLTTRESTHNLQCLLLLGVSATPEELLRVLLWSSGNTEPLAT